VSLWQRLRAHDARAGRRLAPPPWRAEWGPAQAVVPSMALVTRIALAVAVTDLAVAVAQDPTVGLPAAALVVGIGLATLAGLGGRGRGGLQVRRLAGPVPLTRRAGPPRQLLLLALPLVLTLVYGALLALGVPATSTIGLVVPVLGQALVLRRLRRLEEVTGGRVVWPAHWVAGLRGTTGLYLLIADQPADQPAPAVPAAVPAAGPAAEPVARPRIPYAAPQPPPGARGQR